MAQSANQIMLSIAKEMQLKFTFKNVPVSPEEVFADDGLLPAFAKRADQLCQLCFGYGIGMRTEKIEGGKLGKKVIFDDVTPSTLRYLCLLDVLIELKDRSPTLDSVNLDELQYE